MWVPFYFYIYIHIVISLSLFSSFFSHIYSITKLGIGKYHEALKYAKEGYILLDSILGKENEYVFCY